MDTDDFIPISEEDDEEKLDALLEGIEENRKHYGGMLTDIKDLREKIDALLPKNMDYKKKYLFEERMKTITSIIGMELDVRKTLENSYKTEIELRRKLTAAQEEEMDKAQRVQELAEALSSLNNNSGEGKKNRINLNVSDDDMEEKLKV